MRIDPNTRAPILLIAALALVSACSDQAQEAEPKFETLVSTEWLSEHINDSDLVVLDCTVLIEMDESGGFTSVSGRANYEEGHIPSAGFADLTSDLANGESSLQYALPTPERFAAAMGALGVGDDSRVVLYDGSGSAWAARVWWMLRWVGFDRAALLDGGLEAWIAEDRPLSTELPNRPGNTLTSHPRPELIADRDEVFAAIEDEEVVLVDALPEEHYSGEIAFYARPGHIPGAINISVQSLTDEEGRYRPFEELVGLHRGDRTVRHITYCGGGIAASSSAFIMTRLGFEDVAVYTASLQEWATDTENPMEVGTR
jgi:thiosulfate/3-mercaptopyruvate sulfurtransferase